MKIRVKHDEIFKKAMENPIVAREFFDKHLSGNIKSRVDLNSLRIEKESFIEKNLRKSFSDILFTVDIDGRNGHIYLLLEHQSKPDHFMAFRLMKYMLSICNRHISNNPESKTLPVIYPVVFYNGREEYNSPLCIWNLFEDADLTKNIWNNDYKLIDINKISDEEIKKKAWTGILEFFMKHIHEREIIKIWEGVSKLLPEIVKVESGFDYIEMFLYYSASKIKEDDGKVIEDVLKSNLNEEQGDIVMRTWADSMLEKGIEQGMERGMERGVEKTAINLIKKKIDVEFICEVTGLTKEQIIKLKSTVKKNL